MRIKSLEIKNFKLFEEKFDRIRNISQTDMILLNGPNGYGKTTIFDALELALTGKIKRINSYNVDLGVTLNDKPGRKILIADPTKEAYAAIALETDDGELRLERVYPEPPEGSISTASTDNNPRKIFDQFEFRLFFNGDEIVGESEKTDVLKKYHLDNVEEFFDKCCFLSQDEHLQFLKETKKDKSIALEFLFQLLEDLEQKRTRVAEISRVLKNINRKNDLGYTKILKDNVDSLRTEINALRQKTQQTHMEQEMQEGITAEYQSLFAGKGIKWDEKELRFNDGEYEEAVSAIDDLIYYAQHQSACADYSWNMPFKSLMNPFSGGDDIRYEDHPLEYAYRYYPLVQKGDQLEEQYHRQLRLEQLKQTLESREVHKINWETVNRETLLEEDKIEAVREAIEHVGKLEQLQGTTERIISSIVEARKVLLQRTKEAAVGADEGDAKQQILSDGECPYCGRLYDKKEILEAKFQAEEEKLLSLSGGTAQEIRNQTEAVYEKYLNSVVAAVQERLQDGIPEETYKKLQEAKKHKADMQIVNELLHKLQLSLPEEYQDDITELARGYERLLQDIGKGLKEIPEEIAGQLEAKGFWNDYDKYYDRDWDRFIKATASLLQAKREYIKRRFYDSGRRLIQQREEELEKAEKRVTKLKEIYDELAGYQEAVEEGTRDYKRQVIHDIEPLLHVYTAKILQQKFCGKSIFISTDKKMESFQLVHSAEDNQDILYNMSSGQLAAVSISFLLCMHQVYAQRQSLPVLLIDDPIQTIDDVNMVGLVDILRFEFPNTQIFISTHEQKFEWYLRYKYEKAQKKIEPYNMKDIVLGACNFE